MVSLSTIFKGGALVATALTAYLVLKNAAGIGGYLGSTIGGGITQGLSSFGSAFTAPFSALGPNESESTQTLQGIIQQEGLEQQVTNIPDSPIPVPLTPLEKGRLSLAGFLEANSLQGNIDIQTGVFRNQYTTQDLDFVIDPNTGRIKTGTVGIGSATLAAQKELSARYGIPTFDTKGNLSTFGGFASGTR